jgi:hypothetical protein
MSARLRALTPVVLAVGGIGVACSGPTQSETAPRADTRVDRRADTVMSPQELSEARRRAGFESASEIEENERRRILAAAEAHVTARIDQYLSVLDAIEADLTELERTAAKLTTASALIKFTRSHQRGHAKIDDAFAQLERRGAEGGELHSATKRVYERWQDLVSGLEPNVAEDPRFAEELAGIREALTAVRTGLATLRAGEGGALKAPGEASSGGGSPRFDGRR